MATVVVALSAFSGTLIAAFFGPLVSTRAQAFRIHVQQITNDRINEYAKFMTGFEALQLEIDLAVLTAAPIDTDRFERLFHDLEASRAHIDLLGSAEGRRWAYRCRLAVEETERVVKREVVVTDPVVWARAKMHMARASLLAAAQRDIRVERRRSARATLPDDPFPDTYEGHRGWLDVPPDDDAINGVRLALRLNSPWPKGPAPDAPIPPDESPRGPVVAPSP